MSILLDFISSEDGAVTVDWVVMTAMGVGLTLSVMAVMEDGVETASTGIGNTLTDMPIRSDFAQWEALRNGN